MDGHWKQPNLNTCKKKLPPFFYPPFVSSQEKHWKSRSEILRTFVVVVIMCLFLSVSNLTQTDVNNFWLLIEYVFSGLSPVFALYNSNSKTKHNFYFFIVKPKSLSLIQFGWCEVHVDRKRLDCWSALSTPSGDKNQSTFLPSPSPHPTRSCLGIFILSSVHHCQRLVHHQIIVK